MVSRVLDGIKVVNKVKEEENSGQQREMETS